MRSERSFCRVVAELRKSLHSELRCRKVAAHSIAVDLDIWRSILDRIKILDSTKNTINSQAAKNLTVHRWNPTMDTFFNQQNITL